MKWLATELPGVWLIEADPLRDERGYFANLFERGEFEAKGLKVDIARASVSYNSKRGTLRGMHWQAKPFEEAKIVRCTRGAIFDVALNVRSGRWTSVELTAESPRALFIPEGLAHGFQTLRDDSEISYLMTSQYSAEHGRGVRWNDPAFGIRWPLEVSVISPRDASYADFQGK